MLQFRERSSIRPRTSSTWILLCSLSTQVSESSLDGDQSLHRVSKAYWRFKVLSYPCLSKSTSSLKSACVGLWLDLAAGFCEVPGTLEPHMFESFSAEFWVLATWLWWKLDPQILDSLLTEFWMLWLYSSPKCSSGSTSGSPWMTSTEFLC